MARAIRVRSVYGGTTYEVRTFWGCVGLHAITGHGISAVADYYYPSIANVFADDFVEVK